MVRFRVRVIAACNKGKGNIKKMLNSIKIGGSRPFVAVEKAPDNALTIILDEKNTEENLS